jgi:hypothetical protein
MYKSEAKLNDASFFFGDCPKDRVLKKFFLRGIPLKYSLRGSKEKRGTSSLKTKSMVLENNYSVVYDSKYMLCIHRRQVKSERGFLPFPL